jgi:hypothetical protein
MNDVVRVVLLILCLPPTVAQNSVVNVNYGFQQVVACHGATVSVTWQGTHNIQEVASSSCSSSTIGQPVIGFKNSGHTQSFTNNELSASAGSTRFFKCTSHCGASSSRFEVSCPNSPSPSPQPSQPTTGQSPSSQPSQPTTGQSPSSQPSQPTTGQSPSSQPSQPATGQSPSSQPPFGSDPFNPHNYPNTMTMSALVNISGIHQTNGSLWAFDATGAVRGVQQTPSIPPFGAYVGKAIFQIMLYGDTAGDVLHFAFGPIPLAETVDFEINGNTGSVVAPFVLTGLLNATNQPVPFTNTSQPSFPPLYWFHLTNGTNGTNGINGTNHPVHYWTILIAEYPNISASAGAPVTQGNRIGTLVAHWIDTSMNILMVIARPEVTFDTQTNFMIGNTFVAASNIYSVSFSVSPYLPSGPANDFMSFGPPPPCVSHCNFTNGNCPKNCSTTNCSVPEKTDVEAFIANDCVHQPTHINTSHPLPHQHHPQLNMSTNVSNSTVPIGPIEPPSAPPPPSLVCPRGTTVNHNHTLCIHTICSQHQFVHNHSCVPCLPGTENSLMDDAAGPNTRCRTSICGLGYFVFNHSCVRCALGKTNVVNENATGTDSNCTVVHCKQNQYVLNHLCVACPRGTTNPVNGTAATGEDTSCTPVVCGIHEQVKNHTCVSCPPGSTNTRNDDASAADTSCLPTFCALHERVLNHTCVACGVGSTNYPGNDCTQGDTTCLPVVCSDNEYVQNHKCVHCLPGTSNIAGDVAAFDDTTCDKMYCNSNQRVSNHVCVPCPHGETNVARDDASGADTKCDPPTDQLTFEEQMVVDCVRVRANWAYTCFLNIGSTKKCGHRQGIETFLNASSGQCTSVQSYCENYCNAKGYGCNDYRTGANQLLSCSQACHMRLELQQSSLQCASLCDRTPSSGCTLTVAGHTYQMCHTCSKQVFMKHGIECRFGVCETKACYDGCSVSLEKADDLPASHYPGVPLLKLNGTTSPSPHSSGSGNVPSSQTTTSTGQFPSSQSNGSSSQLTPPSPSSTPRV